MSSNDVIVIGGGLVGTAVAYGLAQAGRNITVLDEGDDAFRASRGNFGLIWVHGKGRGCPQYARWTRESARHWPALAARLQAETGIDVQARQTGAFNLCFSGAELEARRERLAAVRDEAGGDYPYEILERAALLQRLPHVGPTVAGASFSTMDGHVRGRHPDRRVHGTCGLRRRHDQQHPGRARAPRRRQFPRDRPARCGAGLGRAAGDDAGWSSDLPGVDGLPGRLPGHVPQRRDPGRGSRVRIASWIAGAAAPEELGAFRGDRFPAAGASTQALDHHHAH